MTLEASVHAFRLRVIARAQVLGNVSQACREFGISRTLFYRWQRRSLAYGPRWAVPQAPRATPRAPPHPERGGRTSHPGAVGFQYRQPLLPHLEADPAQEAVDRGWGELPAAVRGMGQVGTHAGGAHVGHARATAQTAGLLTERTLSSPE